MHILAFHALKIYANNVLKDIILVIINVLIVVQAANNALQVIAISVKMDINFRIMHALYNVKMAIISKTINVIYVLIIAKVAVQM